MGKGYKFTVSKTAGVINNNLNTRPHSFPAPLNKSINQSINSLYIFSLADCEKEYQIVTISLQMKVFFFLQDSPKVSLTFSMLSCEIRSLSFQSFSPKEVASFENAGLRPGLFLNSFFPDGAEKQCIF